MVILAQRLEWQPRIAVAEDNMSLCSSMSEICYQRHCQMWLVLVKEGVN